MKKLILLFLLYSSFLHPTSIPQCYFEHYGAEDGLPQNTVMKILQDKKGMIWLSTWDGLSKFDGYKFTTYLNSYNSPYFLRNNRIDFILEDKLGYIWTLSYDHEAHRFDPKTEQFIGIRTLIDFENLSFSCNKIQSQPSGKVWLLSDNEGCICIEGDDFQAQIYNVESGKIKSNQINSIFEDSLGQTWILTDLGITVLDEEGNILTDYDSMFTTNSDHYLSAKEFNENLWIGKDKGEILTIDLKNKTHKILNLNTTAGINGIEKVNDNKYLITTNSLTFFLYNPRNQNTTAIQLANYGYGSKKDDAILSFYIDKKEKIWFETKSLGVYLYNPNNNRVDFFTREQESPIVNITAPLFIILEDKKQNIWIQPKGGGFSLYDEVNNKLIPFYNKPNSDDWRFSSMLHAAFIDKQDNLWLGTHSDGLDKVIFSNEIFGVMKPAPQSKTPMSNNTRCIFEDNDKNKWISTKDGLIHVYDKNSNYLGHLTKYGSIGKGHAIEGITYCMMQDQNNQIWIGTKGHGIYILTKNGKNNYKLKQMLNNPDDVFSLSNNNVYNIFEDSSGNIWVGCYGGGLNLYIHDSKFINHLNKLTNYPIQTGLQIRVLNEDKHGNICVGTTLGLIMFNKNFDTPEQIQFKRYSKSHEQGGNISANDIFDIVTTKDEKTYLTTFGGGVNEIVAVDSLGFPSQFKYYTTQEGLFSNIALKIAEDFEGKLWVSSEGNISVINPQTNEVKTYSEIYKIIKGFSFTEGTECIDSNGIVYFGFTNGILTIDPTIKNSDTYNPYVALTGFQINNKAMPIDPDSPLKLNIDDMTNIELNNKQNSFNIEYAAIDYYDIKQIQYAHKLDGFDKEWIINNNQRYASYNNLTPGTYTFRVKSTNKEGIWLDNEHTLSIEIVPSFWQTRWAILLYIVIITVILTVIFRSLFIYYKLKYKIKMGEEEIEMKTRFFMDISHEIRTPLTMIVSPIENIIENVNAVDEIKSQLTLVMKNANRMLKMVNQILDFRKIEKSKLNIQKIVFGTFIEDVCKNFAKTAELHGIELIVSNELSNITLWIDKDNVEKLFFNLLSNAIKFTPASKTIHVSVYQKGNQVALKVADEGIGMPKKIQEKLFTRFATFSTDKSKPSTGIGLSIVKEIANKHKASIQVWSEENKGSTFLVLFQLGFDHFDEKDIELFDVQSALPSSYKVENTDILLVEDTEANAEDTETNDAPNDIEHILIVEDDHDLRKYLVTILDKDFVVIEAEDGQIGFDKAMEHQPDFILSDIMMPNVDGIELLQKIKSNEKTSHIPFVLLSAKVAMESRLEGLKYGADDYLTKPFSIKYLKARIKNILEQRKQISRSILAYQNHEIQNKVDVNKDYKKTENEDLSKIITEEDKEFILKVQNIIKQNIDNNEFVVEDIADALFMSRTVFFKKMKLLTGQAPVQFIREARIQHAAQMILETDYTIKEIAFMIGISDTKYFTKWFKIIVGDTPSKFRETNKKNR